MGFQGKRIHGEIIMIDTIWNLAVSWWHWIFAIVVGAGIFFSQVKKARSFVMVFITPILAMLSFPNKLLNTIDSLAKAVDSLGLAMTDVHNLAIIGNAKASMIFEEDPIPRFECNTNGQFTWTNRALQEIFGLSGEQMKGDGWLAAIHPDDLDSVAKRWRDTVAHWIPYRARYRVVNVKTNKEIKCEATAAVISDTSENALTIWGKLVPIIV